MLILPPRDLLSTEDQEIDLKSEEHSFTLFQNLRRKVESLLPPVHSEDYKQKHLAWHKAKHILAIADNNLIFLLVEDRFLENPLSVIGQKCDITCLAWDEFSDILIVGTEKGLFTWRISGLNDSLRVNTLVPFSTEINSNDSWTQCRQVHSIHTCPRGRIFLAISTVSTLVASIVVSRNVEVSVWDLFGGSFSILTLPVSFQTPPCAQWCPTGQLFALGSHRGEVILVETDSWRATLSFSLPSGISALQWLGPSDLIVSAASPSLPLTLYSATVSASLDSRLRDGDEGGVILELSPLPFHLPPSLLPEPPTSDDLQISSLLAQAHSRMLAITFSHSSGPSCIGLFLCISRPFLSLALVRFVSPPPLSPTCTPVPLEVVFLQGGAGGGSSSLVTLWSSRVLTMDSASVQKYD